MKKILTILFAIVSASTLWADNTITYKATEKLPETTDEYSSGFHTNAFNVAITSHTFSNGTGTITFAGEVTTIKEYAFYDCTGLTSITIPSSVKYIHAYGVFSNCNSLTSITVASDNINFSSQDGVLFNKTKTNLIQYPIGNLRSTYSIPSTVTSIGNYAFEDCSGLTSLTIPKSVTTIRSYAFSGCSGLTSVTIGNSVTTIGDDAFSGCSGLTSLTIPNSVITIGKSAFNDVNNIVYNGTATGSPWGAKCVNGYVEGYLVYNNTTKTILCGCSTAAKGEITIQNSVTTIGDYAFEGCSSLTSVTIPNSVTTIGDYAFRDCSGLISVTIPNSVKTIGDNAFSSCSGLTSVTIGNSVTTIGSWAFSLCSGLTSVTIPNSVTTIGSNAFLYVNNIVYNGPATGSPWGAKCVNGYVEGYLVYNNTTKTILCGCSTAAKGEITIPNSVTEIGWWAFRDCSGLTSITCKAITPPTGKSGCFDGVSKSIPIYVHPKSIKAYKQAYEWKEFDNIQANPNDYATVSCIVENGKISGKGTYIKGDKCTLIVTPNYGYHFSQWNDGNKDNPRTFVVTQDSTFIAKTNKNIYTLQVLSADESKGIVDGSQTAEYLDIIEIKAIPIGENIFYRWSDGSTQAKRQIQLTKNSTLIAYFGSATCLISGESNFGYVEGTGIYPYGSNITLTAVPFDHYHFAQWVDGNKQNPRQVTVSGDTTYTAVFEIDQHRVTIVANAVYGYVDGFGTYNYGDYVVLTAFPDNGYRFVKWSNGNEYNPYVFVIEEDIEIEAIYELVTDALDEVPSPTHPRKVMIDGNIYMQINDNLYNALGNKIK